MNPLAIPLHIKPFISKQRETNTTSGIARFAYRSTDPVLIVLLRNLDANMYLFYDSFKNGDDWASNIDNGVLPNFRTQQSVYSNISNGVGVFGAYTKVYVYRQPRTSFRFDAVRLLKTSNSAIEPGDGNRAIANTRKHILLRRRCSKIASK